MTRETNAFEKLGASIVNVIVVFILFLPFYFLIDDLLFRKIILVLIFFLYNLVFLIFNNNRCVGMMVMGTYYDRDYSKFQYLVYNILYTLSFASLLFYIYFPFDLFLVNMIFLQLPCVLLKKTTLHGCLAGKITTIKNTNHK